MITAAGPPVTLMSAKDGQPAVWNDMSVAILRQIASRLDKNSLQQSRLVCSSWRQPASSAVQVLSPRFTGRLGLQWHDLPLLSQAFQACEVLDLRQKKIPLDSGQFLKNTGFNTVLLSNMDEGPSPGISFAKLHNYMTSAQSHKPSLSFEVHIHQPMSYAHSHVRDQEIQRLVQYPAAAHVVKLHLYTMPVPVTQAGLSCIAQLTALTELSIICCEDINSQHFKMISALTGLIDLQIGPLKGCSSQGIMEGLVTLTQLQKLTLTDAINMQDSNIVQMSETFSATLQSLSLRNCPLLTDYALSQIALPKLSALFFSSNHFITLSAVELLASRSPSLVDIDCRGCAQIPRVGDWTKLRHNLLMRKF